MTVGEQAFSWTSWAPKENGPRRWERKRGPEDYMPQHSAVHRVPVDGTPQLTQVIRAFEDAGVAITRGPKSFDIPCPAHDDEEASCTVSDGDRGVRLFCHAGCDQDELFHAAVVVTGLRQQDFFYQSRTGHSLATSSEPLTIAALAEAKRLPPTALVAHGVRESPQGLRIPYWDEAGNIVATRVRFGLVARRGSCWDRRGTRVSPYGAWRVPSYRRGQTLLIVEGESDSWAAWHYSLPVIGIPGKTHARRALSNAPGLLDGFKEIVIIEEPDDHEDGALVRGVRRALTDAGSQAEVFVMRLPVKDVSELHLRYGAEGFVREFSKAHRIANDAATWDPPGPIPPDAARIARWVQRTSKESFKVRHVKDGSGLTWAQASAGIKALLAAAWLREVPQRRRVGRPSPCYRKSPLLWAASALRSNEGEAT